MRALTIAVLGPSFGNPLDQGGRKRLQIRDNLRKCGHDAFFPEEKIGGEGAFIVRTRDLLRSPDVDLVIILHIEGRSGVSGEVVALVLEDDIMAKAAILVPVNDHEYERDLVDNSINQYRVQVPYNEAHFRDCNLLNECMEIVDEVLTEKSPLFLRHGL